MKQDVRTPFEHALGFARASAFSPGEFDGQEGFMTASEIRALARRAGVGPGVSVLDVCCGIGGPGGLVAGTGCDYVGVDFSPTAIGLARARLPEDRLVVARVPPLPGGTFDVVLLLETMLAFEDKAPLVDAVAAALRPGGRFAFTLEAGAPLTAAERAVMPDADTVWLTPLDEIVETLGRAGLRVTWQADHSRSHRRTAAALARAYALDADAITDRLGHRALDDLLAAHRRWIEWLDTRRVRKLALVAERL